MGDPTDNALTVWIFRGERVPRTFRVPHHWVRSFLWTVGGLVALSAVLLAVSLRLTWLNQRLNPQRVTALELELEELRRQESAGPATLPAPDVTAEPTARSTTPAAVETPSLPAATAAPETPTTLVPGFYARLFPPGLSMAERVPIRLDQPRATWVGRRLRADFALSYVDPDGGSQQGHLMVIARGPETLVFHPPNALGDSASPLITPERGESFSVSRFREGRAEFGPFASTSTIRDVTVLVFDLEGRLLLRQVVAPVARAAPAPVPTRAPIQNQAPAPAPVAPPPPATPVSDPAALFTPTPPPADAAEGTSP